jgi:hypothetical protein
MRLTLYTMTASLQARDVNRLNRLTATRWLVAIAHHHLLLRHRRVSSKVLRLWELLALNVDDIGITRNGMALPILTWITDLQLTRSVHFCRNRPPRSLQARKIKFGLNPLLAEVSQQDSPHGSI